MGWLDKFFGSKPADAKEKTRKGTYHYHGGELKRAVRDYVDNAKGEFTVPQIADAIGFKSSSHSRVNGLSVYLRELEKAGVVKCLTTGNRYPGQPNTWKKVETQAKPQPKERKVRRYPVGGLEKAIREVIKSFNGPFEIQQIGDALGRNCADGGGVYTAMARLEKKGVVKIVERGAGTRRGKWELARKYQTKPEPPKSETKPALVSEPIVIPFYHDADYRVVARKDKRVIALVEEKRTDALGKERWVTAETSAILYQQALKAVCGQLIGR